MKLRNYSFAFCTMILLGTAAFLGGCATTGMDRSVKTSNSIRDVDSDIRKMFVQIDVTAASLDALVAPGQQDVKKALKTYTHDLDTLEHEGKRALKHIDEMREHSTEYFGEWEKQGGEYKNPEIRELSEERRIKLAAIYARVPAAGAGIKVAYNAYLTNLKEIKTYLSNDLTPQGLITIDPIAKRAIQDKETLKSSVQPLLAAMEEIKAELYSGKK